MLNKDVTYDWCECGRLIGGKYDDPRVCCMKELVKEDPVEEASDYMAEELDEVILEEEEAPEEVVEEEESDDDGEDLEAYLEELPVKELKKLCEEADLSKKGKKADLVARLLK